MSEYKVSFNLLKQQIDEMKNVSTQMLALAEKVTAASANLGQDELLATARTSLINVSSNMGSKAELLAIASATLGEIIEQYTGTETKNITRAEGTRAHSRDFYKNPVTISDGAGDIAATSVVAGVAAGTASTVAGAEVGAASAVAGAEVGAVSAVMGAEVGADSTLAGVNAGVAATTAGAEAATAAGLGGVALGAGVAMAGAAAGIAGAVGAKKLANGKATNSAASTKGSAVEESDPNGIKSAEAALQKARDNLDNM